MEFLILTPDKITKSTTIQSQKGIRREYHVRALNNSIYMNTITIKGQRKGISYSDCPITTYTII